MVAFGFPFGSLAGGLSQGIQTGEHLSNERMRSDMQLASLKLAQQQKNLAFMEKLEGQLTDAVTIPNDAVRKATLESLWQATEQFTGQPVPDTLRKFIGANPEESRQMLDMAKEKGIPLAQLFDTARNPMMAAAGFSAFGKAMQQREAAAAFPGAMGTGAPSAVPAPAPTPDATGGQPMPAPAAAAPAPATPDQQLQSAAANVKQAIDAVQRQIGAVMVNPKVTDPTGRNFTALQVRLTELEKTYQSLTSGYALTQAQEADKPISDAEAKASGLPPGTKRRVLDAKLAAQGQAPSQPPAVAAPTTVPAPAAPAPQSGTAPGAAAPAAGTPNTPEAEVQAHRQRGTIPPDELMANVKRRSMSVDTLGDKNLVREAARDGITTVGQLEDRLKDGTFKPKSPEEVQRSLDQQSEQVKLSTEDMKGIAERGLSARGTTANVEVIASAAQTLGPSGPWMTPTREFLFRLAPFFGIQNPRGMGENELIKGIVPKMAVQVTSQMKGSQSDREFEAGIATSAGNLNSQRGLALLAVTARETSKLAIAEEIQARRWIGTYGDLYAKDKNGYTFRESFQDNLKASGYSVAGAVAKALKVDPDKLLHGDLTDFTK